jgi:hypothetical protein
VQNVYEKIPSLIRGGMVRYVEFGVPCGSFLKAVIDNDLKEACGRADENSIRALREIVMWFYNYSPPGCYGKAGSHDAWISREDERPRVYSQDKGLELLGYTREEVLETIQPREYDYVADDLAFDADREGR